jgi:hypothetical protein
VKNNQKGIGYIEVLIASILMLLLVVAMNAVIISSIKINVGLQRSQEATSRVHSLQADIKNLKYQIVSIQPRLGATATHLHVILQNPLLYSLSNNRQYYNFAVVAHDDGHFVPAGFAETIRVMATSPRVKFDINGDGIYNEVEQDIAGIHPDWFNLPAFQDNRGGIRLYGVPNANQPRPGIEIDTSNLNKPFTFRILAWVDLGNNKFISNFYNDDIEYLVLPGNEIISTMRTDYETIRQVGINPATLQDYNAWGWAQWNNPAILPHYLQNVQGRVSWKEGKSEVSRNLSYNVVPVVESSRGVGDTRLVEIIIETEESLWFQRLISDGCHSWLNTSLRNYLRNLQSQNARKDIIINYINNNTGPNRIEFFAARVLLNYLQFSNLP